MTNEIAKRILEAAEVISQFPRGQVIDHLQMEALIGESRLGRRGRFYDMVSKLKSHLRVAHGIFLRTLHKTGYQIVEPGSEINITLGAFQRGVRTTGRAVAHTQMIRIQDILDMEKRRETLDTSNKMANIHGMLRNSMGPLVRRR